MTNQNLSKTSRTPSTKAGWMFLSSNRRISLLLGSFGVVFCLIMLGGCPATLPASVKMASTQQKLSQSTVEHCAGQGRRCRERLFKLHCEYRGGSWVQFTNGCRDLCAYKRGKKRRVCTMDTPMGCACGKGRCWTGVKCEAL